MNRYSKILHHISPSTKELKEDTSKSSSIKKRTFEEYEAEQKKTETDRLKEEVNELKKNIQFLEKYIIQQHETLFELKEYIKDQPKEKVIIKEGLLNEPPNIKNADPLTPLDQKFVTFQQLSDHYRLFTNRVLEQMATIGGGGETKLKYLDDIVGIATDPSTYDGKYLKYDDSIGKFVFDIANGSQNLNTTLGFGNTSILGMSVGVVTATRGIFTDNATPGSPAIQVTGIVTSDPSNHGLVEVGELNFTDTNIIASFSDEVDGYTQLVLQNKSDGLSASADIVVNNDRAAGAENYGSFGINGSNYDPTDAFSDPNGTYLYATGGSLTVGTFNNYDVKFVANNLVSIRLDSTTAVPYFGFVTPTISLFNPIAVFTYDSPQYSQIQIQNISDGYAASVDYVASTDTATDTSEYIDMGINCSGFESDGLWSAKDGYLYVKGPTSGPGGNLVIGTIDGGDVIFHTSTNSDERVRITNDGVGIGTTIARSKLTVEGNVYISGVTTSNEIAVNQLIKFNDTNVAIGDTFTGFSNSTGYGNVFVGTSAGRNTTIGASNNFIGDSAGYTNSMGSNNNFLGVAAGYNNSFGFNNNFFGFSCGYNNSEGYYNNFVGDSAGYSNTFGNFNNFFGKNAGYNNQTGSYNIAIGYNVNLPILNGDDQLVIGKNTNAWIVGNSSYNVGIGTTNPRAKLSVVGNINASGIVTGSSFRATSGFIQAADGTNSFYIYSGNGNVAFQGTIGASQINSASGYKAIDFGVTTTPSVNVANGLNVGTGGTIITASNGGLVGIGTTNPTKKLEVQGGDLKVGINTATGVVLTDSNGVSWRLIVNTNGSLSTVQI